MELAIKENRKNPSGFILYLGRGKGEEYSYLPFKKCFRKLAFSFVAGLSGFVLLLILVF